MLSIPRFSTGYRNESGFATVFLLVLTVIRLVFAAHIELSPNEGYFFLWAKHPDISYYNAGPGIALAILAGTNLFGADEFGVRFLSPIAGLVTSLFVYLLARKLYSDRVAFWSTFLLNLTPAFNIGSILITIDSLATLFWSAALYCFLLALERSPNFSFYWPMTGVLIGLGFLCTYINALQLLLIGFFLLVVPKFRKELCRPGFYVLLLCFVPALIPPIAWNQEHEWITLTP
ncbi:MAG: glycosyltransferase family 39 protein, partial [Verrucomicrobia bacterium]|nr:glycosyltransferase family 39 protein [Verrucomicrobiota bacterium]